MRRILAAGSGIIALLALLLVGAYLLFPGILFKLAVKAERLSAGLVKKEIQVDDHRIAYLEGGKGETLLLIHGFGGSKDYWVRFAGSLTGEYRVVIPDLAGFGESSQIPAASYGADAQLKRLDRFAETLKLERFHLAGNSMGGMFAAMYGAKYPRKVSTVALLAPGGVSSPNPSEAAILILKGQNPLLTRSAEDFDLLLGLCFVKPPFIPARIKPVLAAQAVAQAGFKQKIWDDLKWEPTRETPSAIENALLPYLPEIQAPVLIIWGDGDRILDVGGVPVLEKNLKNYRTVIMKGAGHLPMLERPRETAEHYLGFLKGKK